MKSLYRNLLLAGGIILFVNCANAQVQSQAFEIGKKAEVNVQSIETDYFPRVQHLEMPKPGSNLYNDHLNEIKTKIHPKRNKKGSVQLNSGTIPAPHKLGGFEVRFTDQGVPNDNDMAISNDGIVVAVVNSSMSIRNTSGDLIKEVSFDAFTKPLNLAQHKYDPRVLYDPNEDKFIVVCLNGNNDSTNFIVVGFSKTNDPAGDWNLYAIPGEPLLDTSWSDYPILALHDEELFLTINALHNNMSWQLGFKQSYIWQIDKHSGYNGQTLKTKLHNNIKYNGRPIRNLCAVQGGSQPATGDAYFVSSRNFAEQTDTIFLLTLTGSINEPGQIKIQALKADNMYGVPPHATQIKDSFQTNDARVLDAIVENGKLQFVGNSVVNETAKAGVFHGVITGLGTTSPNLKMNILGHPNYDFGYPSIVYAGRNSLEDDVVIFYNHTSDTAQAGNSVVFYRNGEYSGNLHLVKGGSYVDAMSGKAERWGDYTGAQRRYNQPGTVWTGGYTSYRQNVGAGVVRHYPATYIGAVKNPFFPTSVEGNPYITSPENALKIYPSPAVYTQKISVEFTSAENTYTRISIYDASGKCVANLLNDKVKAGKNKFSFVPNGLQPGVYILRIEPHAGNSFSERFVVR